MAEALRAASQAADRAVLKPVEGTILTVVRASADGAEAAVGAGADLAAVVRAARDAGRVALASTPDLLPVLRDAGVVDAGGAGYLLLLDALANVVDDEPLPEPDGDPSVAPATLPSAAGGEAVGGDQRYEVMYLCDLADERIEDFKHRWVSSATRSSSSAATGCGTATSTRTTSGRRSRPPSTWTAGPRRSA